MRYLSASPFAVGLINIIVLIGTVYGFFTFDLNFLSILVIVLFYILYSAVGLGMMFHRYWTHKSFEFKSSTLKWILTCFGLLAGRGSIVGWVHVHREHHAYSDTEKDPHIRNMSLIKIIFPSLTDHGKNINKFLIRDLLNKDQLFINNYYLAMVLAPVIIITLISPYVAFLCWYAPVFFTNIIWNIFIWIGHHKTLGYKNHSTDDHSANIGIFSFLLLGEGWHNNHHKNPKNWNLKEKWWEFDPIGLLIRTVKK